MVRHHHPWLDLAQAEPRMVVARERDMLGCVSRSLPVVSRVPALQIVAKALTARGTDPVKARERAPAMLLCLNVPERLHALPPTTFSGGEQRSPATAKMGDPVSNAGYATMISNVVQAALERRSETAQLTTCTLFKKGRVVTDTGSIAAASRGPVFRFWFQGALPQLVVRLCIGRVRLAGAERSRHRGRCCSSA